VCLPFATPLQVIMQKLSEVDEYKAAVLQYADDIMNTLLQVFNSRSTSVHEEAMLAVGAFIYACGRQFTKYLPAFYPFLKMGLMNHQEWQVRAEVLLCRGRHQSCSVIVLHPAVEPNLGSAHERDSRH
jgi:hypothetical protein